MKAPKYASKLVHKDGGFVGLYGHELCLVYKQLWGESFTKESLKGYTRHRQMVDLAVSKWGRESLKWVALCDLP